MTTTPTARDDRKELLARLLRLGIDPSDFRVIGRALDAADAAQRPADWSATWRDDNTGAGMTRDEAITALADLSHEFTALERAHDRLRTAGLAMFPDEAWLRVEGSTIMLNRGAAERFSVALAESPPARAALATPPEPGPMTRLTVEALADRLRYASRALHATDPEHTKEWEDCGWGDCRQDRIAILAALTVEKRPGWLPESCPERDQHSPFPDDFDMDRRVGQEWVPSLTHEQAIHPTCGLWALWVPTPTTPPVADQEIGS